MQLNIYRVLNCSRDALTLTVTVSSPGVIPASTQVTFLPNQNLVTVTGLNLTTGNQLQSVTVTYSINGTQAGPPTTVSLAGLTNVC